MNILAKGAILADFAAARWKNRVVRRNAGTDRTLVVRCDRIGDFALWAPFASTPKKAGETRVLLGNAIWIDLARKLLDFDECIPLEIPRFLNDSSYRRAILSRMRAGNFDTVFQSRFYREPLVEELLLTAANPARVVQFGVTDRHVQSRWLERLSRSGAETVVPPPGMIHELERNGLFAESVRGASLTPRNPWRDRPFPVPEEFRGKEYCCLMPGTGKSSLFAWPEERWGAALKNHRFPLVVVTGNASEAPVAERIAGSIPRGVSVAGKYDLTAFAGLVSGAKHAIGNDTGGIHIAAMSGVPSTVLLTWSQPGWFLPYPEDCGGVPGVCPPFPVCAPRPACAGCFGVCRNTVDGHCGCLDAIFPDLLEKNLRSLTL